MNVHSGPVAAAAAVAGLVVVGAVAPVAAPVLAAVVVRNTARTWRRLPAYVDALADVADGATSAGPLRAVRHLPADARLVVTSDLHRGIAGANDWPSRQGTVGVYHALLDHYAAEHRHLVEDGDVEDLWMVGGSTWGATYDVARLASSVLPGRWGRAAKSALYRAQLRRIVAANAATYDHIEADFARHGRYHRVVGNHDDALSRPGVLDELRRVHPGLELLDAVVVGGRGEPGVVVAHGHHTDSWNAPDMAGPGRVGTWLACHVRDVPLLGLDPGLPGKGSLAHLLSGHHPDRLTAVSRAFGANLEQYSMDEVALFDAVRRRWPDADQPDGDDPLLVLGHTHLPVVSPVGPDGRRWWRYLNSGSGVWPGAVTAVEVDDRRSARLVAWCAADVLPPALAGIEPTALAPDGAPVVRVELSPSPDGQRLVPTVAAVSARA